MSEHTRGPWRVMPEEVGRPYIRVRGTIPGGRYKIANVLAPADDDRYHVPDAMLEEVRANARLIAAAPDLLEVARKCAEVFPSGYEAPLAMLARAAIAKATGETEPQEAA